ncbi:MAG: hypothetical protein IKP64_08885 [Selenomonadaceae bacterium]|nr:hypothetical protein [Selenomonadaceae bacterium]
MTTREENLKKINEELEKLDDEQLDKVAGGSWGIYLMDKQIQNTANDSNLLSNLGVSCWNKIK